MRRALCFSHTKYSDPVNYIPDDPLGLEVEAAGSLEDARCRPELLRSFSCGTQREL